jgi:hypothetical protein
LTQARFDAANRRGHPTTEGRVAYRGPNETRSTLPKVKFDLTSDEVLTQRPTLRRIGHHYSDEPLPVAGVASYAITELFGERLRALAVPGVEETSIEKRTELPEGPPVAVTW